MADKEKKVVIRLRKLMANKLLSRR